MNGSKVIVIIIVVIVTIIANTMRELALWDSSKISCIVVQGGPCPNNSPQKQAQSVILSCICRRQLERYTV